MNSFLNNDEIKSLGFKSVGNNVLISRKASFYGNSSIEIGNNVRIDDFCIISGKVKIGNHIHISAYVALYGAYGIELEDYTGISPRSTVFSAMDDFSGDFLIGPIHPKNSTNVTGGKVLIKRFAQIGCNCVLFPGITINEGSVIGAMSLVTHSLQSWGIYVGIPVRYLRSRTKGLLSHIPINYDGKNDCL